MVCANIFLFPMATCVIEKTQWKKVFSDWKTLLMLFFGSFSGFVVFQSGMAWALQYTTVNVSALMNPLKPVFMLMFTIILKWEKASPLKIIGIITAFIGTVISVNPLAAIQDFKNGEGMVALANIVLFLCVLQSPTSNILQKLILKRGLIGSTGIIAMYNLFGIVMMLCIFGSSVPEFIREFPSMTSKDIALLLFLGIGGTCVGHTLSVYTLKHMKSVQTFAAIISLQGPIGILFSSIVGEYPSIWEIIGMIIIIAGLIMTLVAKTKLGDAMKETEKDIIIIEEETSSSGVPLSEHLPARDEKDEVNSSHGSSKIFGKQTSPKIIEMSNMKSKV
ncbi:hypothetical protein ADUPG1_012264 [Aduncisulcus paluster]|uniref:EamA domain-containing protein n=1 Tax=Aduncisulcus paluster TaxID=2918883 RepID=A0ABQ5JYW8_9EUKA|nr:hypothetical protein ADUPG1_012264 [Aduncisulcus paluster]